MQLRAFYPVNRHVYVSSDVENKYCKVIQLGSLTLREENVPSQHMGAGEHSTCMYSCDVGGMEVGKFGELLRVALLNHGVCVREVSHHLLMSTEIHRNLYGPYVGHGKIPTLASILLSQYHHALQHRFGSQRVGRIFIAAYGC